MPINGMTTVNAAAGAVIRIGICVLAAALSDAERSNDVRRSIRVLYRATQDPSGD